MAQTKDGCGATISGGTARDWRDLTAALKEAQKEAQEELGLTDGEVVGRAFKREGGSTFAYLAAPGAKGAASDRALADASSSLDLVRSSVLGL